MNKASVACGPLVKWAIAQVSYAEMLQKVDPLRMELQHNEEEMLKNQTKVCCCPFIYTPKIVVDVVNKCF